MRFSYVFLLHQFPVLSVLLVPSHWRVTADRLSPRSALRVTARSHCALQERQNIAPQKLIICVCYALCAVTVLPTEGGCLGPPSDRTLSLLPIFLPT